MIPIPIKIRRAEEAVVVADQDRPCREDLEEVIQDMEVKRRFRQKTCLGHSSGEEDLISSGVEDLEVVQVRRIASLNQKITID
jgi:hypothetical protein